MANAARVLPDADRDDGPRHGARRADRAGGGLVGPRRRPSSCSPSSCRGGCALRCLDRSADRRFGRRGGSTSADRAASRSAAFAMWWSLSSTNGSATTASAARSTGGPTGRAAFRPRAGKLGTWNVFDTTIRTTPRLSGPEIAAGKANGFRHRPRARRVRTTFGPTLRDAEALAGAARGLFAARADCGSAD